MTPPPLDELRALATHIEVEAEGSEEYKRILDSQKMEWPRHLEGARLGNPYATICDACHGRHGPPYGQICPNKDPRP